MNSTCYDTCCHGCKECCVSWEHLKTKVVHIDEKPVTHSVWGHTLSVVQCTGSFSPCVIKSCFILSLIFRYSTSKIKTYIHRRIDELDNLLFKQLYQTTKQGKLSLGVKNIDAKLNILWPTEEQSEVTRSRQRKYIRIMAVRQQEPTLNRGHSDKVLRQILR